VRKVFSVSSLILGITFFAVFIVAACAAYYLTAGVFVTAELAVLYAALGLLGALAVVVRGYIFAVLFYIGCALGWATGYYVSTLEGDFAPTAGVITTFFVIGCFTLVGLVVEMRRIRHRRHDRMEHRQTEWIAQEQRQSELLAAQEAKVKAEAVAAAAAMEQVPESESESSIPATDETNSEGM